MLHTAEDKEVRTASEGLTAAETQDQEGAPESKFLVWTLLHQEVVSQVSVKPREGGLIMLLWQHQRKERMHVVAESCSCALNPSEYSS